MDNPSIEAWLSVPVVLTALAISIVMVIAAWKLYAKAGERGWASLVPFYNTYVEFRIAGFNPWLFLLLLIPGVNVVLALIVSYKVGENFGKSPMFNIFWMVLFPIVGWLIIAFGDARFQRPTAA